MTAHPPSEELPLRVAIILPVQNDPEEFLVSALRARFPDMIFDRFDDCEIAHDALRDADALFGFGSLLGDMPFNRTPRLRWFQILGSGTDGIFDRAGYRPDLIVTNATGLAAVSVAEAAMASILSIARGLPEVFRDQQERLWRRRMPQRLRGRRLLIVGSGSIAIAIAKCAAAFGMDVGCVSATARPIECFAFVAGRHELPDRARTADYLVVVTGLHASSQGLVSSEVIDALPEGAGFADLSRGGITDLDALARRLAAGTLRGAVVDVFPEEPLPASSPLWTAAGLTVTPHVGGLDDHYPQSLMPLLVENLELFRLGRIDAMRNRVRAEP